MTLDSEHATTNHVAREGEPNQTSVALAGLDRETLGQLVRRAWLEWANEQPNAKLSWLVEWNELSEPDREVDRRIGETVAEYAIEQFRTQGNADQPRLGQRCHVEGVGFGTIIALKIGADANAGKVYAHVKCDAGISTWREVSKLELLATVSVV